MSETYLDANCTFKPALQTKKKGHSKYLNFLNPDESEITIEKPLIAKFSDESNCIFRPSINPISDALMTKKKLESGENEPRYETLYK